MMKWRKGRSEEESFAFESAEPETEETLTGEDNAPGIEETLVDGSYVSDEEIEETETLAEPIAEEPIKSSPAEEPPDFTPRRRRRSWADEDDTDERTKRPSKLAGFLEFGWLSKHWKTIVLLVFIFGLALYVRGYYGWGPATEDGYLLSGGSDSYYHNRAIWHSLDTGDSLFWEDMLNYPLGTRNPRPPLYDWSVALGGIALDPFVDGDVNDSMFMVFLFSTAFWGALTIFPSYFLAKEAFGKKAGVVAAFLLAIMPGHVTRSVLSNADHDAIALFFIVTAFFFFLRALKTLDQRKWVQSWRKPKEAMGGVKEMVRNNRTSILYALMAALSVISVSLIWKGYAYVIVILTAYFFIQVLINRFRNTDSLAVLMVYAITAGVALLLAFPYYYQSLQIASWYDAPVIMFLAASIFALILIVTHRLPWILVFTGMIMIGVATVLFLYVFAPGVLDTIVGALSSGAGYFVSNKQYETIAEAQAPPFSNLAMSFGIITFWLSFVGVAWAAIQLPKNIKADFIFILIWTAASIYMAVTAARFMFNAAPAFAITAGWVIALIIDKLAIHKFSEHFKRFSRPKLSRGFKFGIIGAVVLLILVAVGLSGSIDLAMGVFVIGMATIIGAFMMNLIAETNPKRYFHLISVLIPLGGALFYLYAALKTEWVLTTSTHGFMLFLMIFIYFVLYLVVRRTKLTFTAGVLFLAFLIVVPNVWAGIDAGIPYETKRGYDEAVYDIMPVFLQPDDYVNQSNWYLGGFGYSLPLNTRYWPAAYDWLATQDAETYPPEDRPAFLSWWDYGFEAVNEGKHPTVADNFLGGHRVAGNFIMAQSEKDAVALLCSRIIEGNWRGEMRYGRTYELSDDMKALLTEHGLNPTKIGTMLDNPEDYIDQIKEHPEIYGPRDDVVQPQNAIYLAIRGYMTQNMNEEEVVSLYHDMSELTGDSIRYFAIDSRMFPFSADNTGIFYAPAKLSDHRIDDIGNQPYDFWELKAVSDTGSEYNLDEIPPDVILDQQNPYKIDYKEMFFNTMMYKTFIGFSPMDIGKEITAGIPGLSGDVAQEQIMPGWNMTHFKLVHRTAYWNPYSAEQIQNHTDEWQAMNIYDAREYQESGEGVVDMSDRSSLYQGVMMLKYYDGAIISGTVRLEDGTPVSGARITISDDFGIPHHMVYSDKNGHYSAIAPFGDIGIITSTGAENPRTLVGGELNITTMHIEDYQAMRVEEDRDSDGKPDYLIDLDPVILSGRLSGSLFWDSDGSGDMGPDEQKIGNAEMVLRNNHLDMETVTQINETGDFLIDVIAPGDQTVGIYVAGRLLDVFDTTITSAENNTAFFGVAPVTLTGNIFASSGNNTVADATVTAWIPGEDIVVQAITGEVGNYTLENVIHGNYSVQVTTATQASPITRYDVKKEGNNSLNLRLFPSSRITGQARLEDGTPVPTNNLRFAGQMEILAQTDKDGSFDLALPSGRYDVTCEYVKNNDYYIHISRINANSDGDFDLVLEKGCKVYGQMVLKNGLTGRNVEVTFRNTDSGAILRTYTNNQGIYTITVPVGEYNVQASARINDVNWTYYSDKSFKSSSAALDITISGAKAVTGSVYWKFVTDTGEKYGLEGATVSFTDTAGEMYLAQIDQSGLFEAQLYPRTNYQVSIYRDGFETISLGTQTAEKLASVGISELLAPLYVPLSGTVMLGDDPLENQNLVIYFEGMSVGAEDTEVQIYPDGTYSIDLVPGHYIVSFYHNATPDNDSVIFQIAEPVELDTDFYTGSPLTLDLEARKRLKTKVTVLSPAPVTSNITFNEGPETRSFVCENGSGVYYLMEGNYVLSASYADNNTIWVGMAEANVSSGLKESSVSVEIVDGIPLRGLLAFQADKMPNRQISFIDRDTGGSINVLTDDGAEYEVYLIPDRTFDIVSDFVDFIDEDGVQTPYRYFTNETILVTVNTREVHPLNLLREDYYTDVSGFVKSGSLEASFAQLVLLSDLGKVEITAGDKGDFNTELRPGNYSVYAHYAPSHMVYLDSQYFGVDPTEGLIIPLIEGFKLSGTTYYNLDQHQVTVLNFTSGEGTASAESNPQGFYEIWLPQDTYDIIGGAKVVERGLNVTYELNLTVDLDESSLINLPMNKIEHVSILLEWDERQKVSARPGDEVTYTVKVINAGNVLDTFIMGASGADPAWIFSFDPVEMQINPGTTNNYRSTRVTIMVPELAKSDQGTVTLNAVSARAGVTSSLEVGIDIIQEYAVVLEETPASSPTFDKGKMNWEFDVKNNGNGEDKFRVVIANQDQLRSSGWTAKFGQDAGELVEDGLIVNMTIGARGLQKVPIVLTRYGSVQSKIASVLVVAYSQGDSSVSHSKYFTLRYPELNPYSIPMTIYGEDVYDAPTGSQTANAGVMVVTVAAALLLFYVARKKRWIR